MKDSYNKSWWIRLILKELYTDWQLFQPLMTKPVNSLSPTCDTGWNNPSIY